ncbi:nucleolar protein 14 [Garra rufa]|uniref:nucleolar protein 14 n=1 Tax=Garra rufa TaxID=137080 RepID=UPI003CCEC533
MRKQQKPSRGLSDKVRKSKAAPEIQKNPFEVKINRKKFDVLGRKSKHDVGLPGVSRSKAIQKRKDTLLKEFRLKDKSNKFIDRRFGEYDNQITPEEKILQRFTLERQRTHDKTDMYNLNEEEELTHYGKSLAEMEKMTAVIDSDSDSEEKGLLSAELTATHFGGGGGLLRKKSAGDEDEELKPKSRQELIEELIIRSKQEKRERQTQKEESQVLTDKLDQEWKSIQSLLSHKTPKAERKDEAEKPKLDQYDMMVRELGFEMKAQPSEKLKSAEEIAREERERLQALEADRLRRMMGHAEEESGQSSTHISADDMNDGFILSKDDRKTLAYKICSLTHMFPEAACEAMQTLFSDGGRKMEETVEVKGRAPMPNLKMLVLLKITALLFPTSDFRHPVTTPAFLYISQALAKCVVFSLEDVCRGLILCCLALEFVSLSKKFFPELLNFLLGLLHLAVSNKHNTGYTLVSPFRQQGRNCDLLVLKDRNASHSWNRKPISLRTAHRIPAEEKDHYRLSVIDSCLDLIKRCTSLYKDLLSFGHIFQPIRTLLANHLPVESYPAPIQDLHREILEAIPEKPSQNAPLVFNKKKPIPLKLFTPKIEQITDYGKKRGNTKEEKERERLKHKYKREFKGALREIRKDTRFLAREKLNDVMSRDAERKRKLKELYGSLATQEGEWKALKRRKRNS